MFQFSRTNYYERVLDIIEGLKLKFKTDNEIIKRRFLYEVLLYEKKRDQTKKYYNGFRFIVTVGSILLPAILSIGQMDPAKLPKNFDAITYWTSWSLSLTITACNGFLQLFLSNLFCSHSWMNSQKYRKSWLSIFCQALKFVCYSGSNLWWLSPLLIIKS